MKKWKLVTIMIAVVVLAMGASSSVDKKNNADDGHFKNLKILPSTISKNDLDSIMDGFTIGLGVRCGFCHARKKDTTQRGLDFASDDKEEKGTAREMMSMVHTLNTTNFNYMHSTKPDTINTIVCYTCHRGMKEPSYANLKPDIQKIEDERQKQWQQHGGK